MSRNARVVSSTGLYHVIIRGPSEITLFKNNLDKIKYLRYMAFYKKYFNFKIHCYCLMDTHAHFLIDEYPSKLSLFMKQINNSYSNYFNGKYNHRGHVLEDRFSSYAIETDSYLIQLSYYIHRNPKSIPQFEHAPEKYPFSSLGIYLNLRKDAFNLVSTNKILQYFSINKNQAINQYKKSLSL